MKMSKIIFTINYIVFLFLVSVSVSAAEEKPSHWITERSFYDWLIDFSRTKGVEVVENIDYQEECGACHFPYQPGLLPEQSWEKLFDPVQLEDHFEDSAELDEEMRIQLLNFVIKNSADKSWYKRSRKIIAMLDEGKYPLRITELPYIKEKHEEIPVKLIRDNEKVNSLSYCDNCHRKADKGIYDDDTVLIPGEL